MARQDRSWTECRSQSTRGAAVLLLCTGCSLQERFTEDESVGPVAPQTGSIATAGSNGARVEGEPTGVRGIDPDPDLPHVLFVVVEELWAGYLDERPPVRLLNGSDLLAVAVAPDWSEVAVNQVDGGAPALAVIDLRSGEHKVLSEDVEPAGVRWSPDGRSIAFWERRSDSDPPAYDVSVSSRIEASRVRIGRVDGSTCIGDVAGTLSAEPHALAWSPDGKFFGLSLFGVVGFLAGAGQPAVAAAPIGALYVARSDTPGFDLLFGCTPAAPWAGGGWAPRGHVFAYSEGSDPRWHIGSPDAGWDERAGTFDAWAPDGKRIAFRTVEGALGISMPDGSDEHIISPDTVDSECAWSHDSRRVACGEWSGAGARLLVSEVDGSRVSRGTDCSRPVWSPAGARIACEDGSVVEIPSLLGSDLVASVAGASSTPLAPGIWSADGEALVVHVASAYRQSPRVHRLDWGRVVELPGPSDAERPGAWSSADPAHYVHAGAGNTIIAPSALWATHRSGDSRPIFEHWARVSWFAVR